MAHRPNVDRLVVDPMVAEIVGEAWGRPAPPSTESAAALLLDFLANAQRGGAIERLIGSPRLDTIGRAAAAAHDRDADDVHWASLTHPGSIVWPGVLAYGAVECSGRQVMRAATVGYQVAVAVAGAVAAAGISRFHRTALAGHAGAAAAVAVARGFDEQRCAGTVALSLTMAGGIGQTMIERSSASGFHRACAAQNGAAAVDFSAAGMTAPRGVLTGSAGLIAACGGTLRTRETTADHRGLAIEETTVRVYPTTGFAQAAVAATVRARRDLDDPAVAADISVGVHPAVAAQFRDPPVSRHWDLLAAVRSAWSTGDPWTVDRLDFDDDCAVTVALHESDDLGIGDALVTARAGSHDVTVQVGADFSHPNIDRSLAIEKWARLGVVGAGERWSRLAAWLGSDELADPAGLGVPGGFSGSDLFDVDVDENDQPRRR